jgi:CheY-like chemotaxis protein
MPREIRVLVVDDSSLCRKLAIECIRRELKRQQISHVFKPAECEDGVDAVTFIARNKSFDMICIDSVMIKMHGLQATKNIRSLGYTGVIVAVTGNVMKEDRDEFIAAGADHFIEKPLDRAKINKIVKEILIRGDETSSDEQDGDATFSYII